jgi:cytochrome c oxidase cbb3-type subunit 4
MSYESVAGFAQTWGLVYMVLLFLGVLVYAFWPGNKEKFKRAARLPLEED